MQKNGSSIFRGANYALQNPGNISPEIPVVTHSSGNHTGALVKASSRNGRKCISVMPENVDDIFTVSAESIIDAMKFVWQHMKIIVEPYSAVTLAAIMENKEFFAGKKIGIITSGGNIDLRNLPF